MDRLTRRMCGGWGLVEGCEINTPAGMRQVVERLAAYENAGITPEIAAMYAKYHDNRGSVIPDLDELAVFRKAQAEGRIMVIPNLDNRRVSSDKGAGETWPSLSCVGKYLLT